MWYNSSRFVAVKEITKKGTVNYPFYKPLIMDPTLVKTEEGSDVRGYAAIADRIYTLHTFTDPNQLLQFALDYILALNGAHAGSIFLWDESSKELVLGPARGPYQNQISGARVKLREGIAGWVADKGLSVLVKNVTEDDRFQRVHRNGNYQSSSFISLPLLAGNKLVGVVNITEREDHVPFDEKDFERAETITKHIAIAYENLKLLKRYRKENEALSNSLTRLKETLKQQEPLVSVGKLAANLAHELNNPLDAIRRFINLALDQVMEDSLAREYLLKAKGGVRRAIQIIRGLLSFARETSQLTLKTAELHSVIEQSLLMASQSLTFSEIHFEKEFCEGTILVSDCGLRTVFQNLLENAHHAMNGKGVIKVMTRRNGKHVIVSVRDTGHGVPEEHKERLFEPFFTTKDKGEGTGIGLAICRDIVERIGGHITFESEEKNGTTFYIMLPYQDER